MHFEASMSDLVIYILDVVYNTKNKKRGDKYVSMFRFEIYINSL